MWFEKSELKADIVRLEKDKRTLKDEVEDLKHQKKMENEDIKHMTKINNERQDIELEKEKIRLTGEQTTAIAKVKDEYQNKTEKQLDKQVTNMKDLYSVILARLPQYYVSYKITEKK